MVEADSLAELAQLIQAFGAVVPDHQRTPWLLEKSIANVSAVLKHDGANFPDFLAAVAALPPPLRLQVRALVHRDRGLQKQLEARFQELTADLRQDLDGLILASYQAVRIGWGEVDDALDRVAHLIEAEVAVAQPLMDTAKLLRMKTV